jgi:hypothetical protein
MLTLSGVVVTDNSATGGVGGAGGAGGAGGTTTGVVAHGAKGVSGGAGGAGQSGGLAQGGGISNATGASLTLFNVTLSANPARGGAGGAGGAGGHGGGISSFGTGGAGGNAGAAGDAGFGVGGGLYNAGTAAVAAVTVSGNRADGGVGGAGGAAGAGGSPGGSSGTSSSGGSGGFGIGGGIDGTLTVANATIDANTAAGAAGGAAGGGASSAGNTGGAEGGGFAAGNTSATTWFGNVTIASNSATGSPAFGGDLSAFFMGSHVHLADTVIAAGTADPGAGDCDGDVGAFVSDGFNLSNDTSGNCKLTQASDKPGTNPLLGPLHDNGGPTATMALRPGSPAIDAGNPSGCTYPGTSSVLTRDQRGLTRPKGAACDIGAFERSLPLAVTGNPSAIGPHGATVIGIVNPEQLPTTYRFQYGKTTAYGSHTAPASAGSGASGVPALARLAGLKPNTVYHYRLVATNTDGSSLPPGIDRSFKTAFGGVEIVSKKATVGSDMKAPIKLSCPANAKTRCSGTLTLTTKVKVKKNGKTTTKTLTLGKTPFAIDNGQTKSVKVKLSQAGFDRLKSKQTLTATATATAVDARGGTPRVTTGKVTLTPG